MRVGASGWEGITLNLVILLQLQVEALPYTIAHAMMDRQLSTASFVSANDIHDMQNSPIVNPRRLHPGIVSAQSSFESYG